MNPFDKRKPRISTPFKPGGIPSDYKKAHAIMEENQNRNLHLYQVHSKTKKNNPNSKKKNSHIKEYTENVYKEQLKKQNNIIAKTPSPVKLNKMPHSKYDFKYGGKSRKRRNKRSIKSKPNKRKTFRKKRVHRK